MTARAGRGWVSWAGCGLFLVALVLRLGPAVADLPHLYDYDEPLFMTFEVGRMYSQNTLEPSGYAHPALYKDLSVATLTAVGGVAGWEGADVIAGPGIFGDRSANNPMPWFVLRAVAALLGAAAVALAWDASRRFGAPDWVAALAGGIGAVAPMLIAIAPRIAPDGFSVFFAMVCVWALAWTLQRPSLRRQAALGLAIGLVVASKYNGAPFALLAVVPAVVGTRSWSRRLMWVGVAGLAAMLAFAITNPYALIHFGEFLDELSTQNKVYSFTLTGETGRANEFNFRTLLDDAGPLAVLALMAVPLVAIGRRSPADRQGNAERWELATAVGLSAGILGWILFQGRYEVRIARNVMPLVLPVCVLGAVSLRAGWPLLRRRRNTAVTAAVVLIVAGWAGLQTTKGLFEFGAAVADERAEARDWINEHIQPGDRIVGEFGTPYLGRSDIDQEEVGLLSELGLDRLEEGDVDWIVSSSETTDGILWDEARWGGQIAFYDKRLDAVCEWQRFRSWNTEIRVGRVCPPDGDTGGDTEVEAGRD